MVKNASESQTFFKLIRYLIFSFKFHSFIENRYSKIGHLPISTENFGKLPTDFAVPVNFEP